MARLGRLSSKPYFLFSTVSSRKEAQKLAKLLVEKRLAACVNIIPGITSFFRWRGKIDRIHECLLVMKTKAQKLKELERVLIRNHSYSVPELVASPIVWGHRPYLKWISENV